jgi:hypothetical protein
VAAENDLRSGVTQHPAVIAQQGERARRLQPLIADAITAYAGSMAFVYVHAVGFAVWMLFIESNPWPKLTLIVSLEAIFLSTFVMIGQNRQAVVPAGQGGSWLQRGGVGTQVQHGADRRDPDPYSRVAQAPGG